MGTTQYCPPLAYQSFFDEGREISPTRAKGGFPLPHTPAKVTRFTDIDPPARKPTFSQEGDGPYPSMSTISSASNSSLGSSSAVSSIVTPTKQASSPRTKKKKKLFAPSQASIAMLNPALAMGINVDEDVYQCQTDDTEMSSLVAGAGSYESLASQVSASRSASPYRYQGDATAQEQPCLSTPELAAFVSPGNQNILTQGHTSGSRTKDASSYEEAPYARSAPSAAALQNSRRRANTIASVFEDDDGLTNPKAASPTRKVAFLIKDPPTDGAAKGNKAHGGLSSSSNKSIARFFAWKRSNGKSKAFGDDEVPSSAPPHITTFDGSTGNISPVKQASPSLPNTPVGHHANLPADSVATPHPKTGQPLKSILRKQSAPALREQARPWASAPTVPAMPRAAEAPGALRGGSETTSPVPDARLVGDTPRGMQQGSHRREPPRPLYVPYSRSTSSDLSRGYSGVGRGVARRASDASSIMIASPVKSPRRKQVPSPFYASHSVHHTSKVSNLDAYASQHTLYVIDDAPDDEVHSMQTRRRSMAQRVVGGINTHGFEEPAPRTMPLGQIVESTSNRVPLPAAAAYRRRSRSVGAMDGPNPFASAFAMFNGAYSHSNSSALGCEVAKSPLEFDRGKKEARALTQSAAASFDPLSGSQQHYVPLSQKEKQAGTTLHKPTDSGSSSSSSNSEDLSLSHATTVVATRRVQLVGTREKATPVSSPSINSVRFTGSSSSNVGSSPRLLATPASKKHQNLAPMVTVLPPTPDLPGSGAFAGGAKLQSSPASSPLKSSEAAEEGLRRTWSERNSCLFALKAATAGMPLYEEPISEDAEDDEAGLYQKSKAGSLHQNDIKDEDDDDSIPGSMPYDFPTVPSVAPLNIKRRQDSSAGVSDGSERNGDLTRPCRAESEVLSAPQESWKKSTAPKVSPSFSNESIISGLDELDWQPLSYSDSQTVLPAITTSANLQYSAYVAAAAVDKRQVSVPAAATHDQGLPSQTQRSQRIGVMCSAPLNTHVDIHTASESSNSSMPSLYSSHTSASSIQQPPSEGRQESGSADRPLILPASSLDSLSSMRTTETSILYQGASSEEVQRYMHRAQLSYDAFSDPEDLQNAGAVVVPPLISVTEEVTPRLGEGSWSQGRQEKESHSSSFTAYPTIRVSDATYNGSPQMAFDPIREEGLSPSMLGPYEGKTSAPRVSSRRTGSRSPSPALSSRSHGGARSITPTQRYPLSDVSRASSPTVGHGLGLDLGAGQMKQGPVCATEVKYTPTRVVVKDTRACLGKGTWEEQQQYFYDAHVRARRPRVAIPGQGQGESQGQVQSRLASPHHPSHQFQQSYQQQHHYQHHQEELLQPQYSSAPDSAQYEQKQQRWHEQSQAGQHYLAPAANGYEALRESGEWEMGVAL